MAGVAPLAAAGGTSQGTIATGCRQCGQAGAAVRVPVPPDRGSRPESTWNLGDLVNDLKQVSKVTGRRFHASSRLAFAFDTPRMSVIILQLA